MECRWVKVDTPGLQTWLVHILMELPLVSRFEIRRLSLFLHVAECVLGSLSGMGLDEIVEDWSVALADGRNSVVALARRSQAALRPDVLKLGP